MLTPSPMESPVLRDDLPRYPQPLQLLRVTDGTILGPSQYISASTISAKLYVSFTQQLRDSNLLPRDREPCLVLDVNGLGLTPGYYLGRLASSYTSLPVYEVTDLALRGLTKEQIDRIRETLTPAQIAILNNLDPCQLQILLTTLTPTQIQMITSSSTPTQVQNLIITTPTVGQSSSQTIVENLTIQEILQLTTVLTVQQITELIQFITIEQLQQLTQLTQQQLITVVNYPPSTISTLLDQMLPQDLGNLITIDPIVPGPVLGNQIQGPGIPLITSQPSSTPIPIQGYAQLMADMSGNIYFRAGGQWHRVGSGSGGSSNVSWVGPFTVDEADFTAPAPNQEIELTSLAANKVIQAIAYHVTEAWGDGAGATVTLSVGITGSLEKYLVNTDMTALAQIYSPQNAHTIESFSGSTSIRVKIISSVNVNTLTTGTTKFWLLQGTLP